MNEKLAEALSAVRERYIADAAGAKKNRRPIWLGAAAAVLAVALCFGLVSGPLAVSVTAVSIPGASRLGVLPSRGDYADAESWDADTEKWQAQRDGKYASADAARECLQPFFAESCREFLSGGTEENRVWSPVNVYIALAMLAEVTGGETRQQILDLLGADSLELLREQVSAVWETVCLGRDDTVCRLANSLWLDRDLSYRQEVMDSLAYYHYASVYQGDLGTEPVNKALRNWVDDNTGGLLTDYTGGISLSPDTALALFSTVYLQALWTHPFSAEDNTEAPFHAPGGDILCTYMNKRESPMQYYRGSR
ncbi:MAG: serpin family protein, partial [Candidatus Limivicinus sp.]